MKTQYSPDALITEKDLSRWLNRSLGSIRRDRLVRRGVPYIRVGRLVRYRREDVLAYLTANIEQTDAL